MTKKVCIAKSYENRYPNGIHIVKKKPKHFALKQVSNKSFTEYSIGSEGYFVPKKGVKLSKC
jgi:hypothetical protein